MKFNKIHSSPFAIGFITLFILLLLWEMASFFRLYNSFLFPSPLQIGKSLLDMITSGQWTEDIVASLKRYLLGFILGNVMGIFLGLLTGRNKGLRNILTPLLNFLRSTPSIALIPLAILWFGIGEIEKIFIITWGVTFPIWLNTHAGTMEVEKEYIWAAKSLGSKGWDLFQNIFLMRSLPYVIAGSRTAISTGFFALAAAEMAGAFSGIAFRIFYSHQMFQTDKMLASIVTIGFLSLFLDRIFVSIMRWKLPWWHGDNVIKF